MLNRKPRRLLLAAFGGTFILFAASPALAVDFHAQLNGDNLTPPGDTDGWGFVRITIDDVSNRLCGDLEVRSLGRVTTAQVFRGDDATPVVRLERPSDNDSYDCITIGDALGDEILANPGAFFVEVATEEFPEGAIRGPLAPGRGQTSGPSSG